MTIEELDNHASPNEIDPEAEALAHLLVWEHVVFALPHLITKQDSEGPIRELVGWYDRVVKNGTFVDEPPIEGLDILIDELALVSMPFDVHAELARARWAIRVAEELVQWRTCLSTAGQGSPGLADATNRLERVVEDARNQMKRA